MSVPSVFDVDKSIRTFHFKSSPIQISSRSNKKSVISSVIEKSKTGSLKSVEQSVLLRLQTWIDACQDGMPCNNINSNKSNDIPTNLRTTNPSHMRSSSHGNLSEKNPCERRKIRKKVLTLDGRMRRGHDTDTEDINDDERERKSESNLSKSMSKSTADLTKAFSDFSASIGGLFSASESKPSTVKPVANKPEKNWAEKALERSSFLLWP